MKLQEIKKDIHFVVEMEAGETAILKLILTKVLNGKEVTLTEKQKEKAREILETIEKIRETWLAEEE